MTSAIEYFFWGIEIISILLGVMGIIIICIGSIKSAIEYIKNGGNGFQNIRLIFGQHLIIGLDFFLGKDLIDTMLIQSGAIFWEELAGILVVVIIRIALTLMAERELAEIRNSGIRY